MTDMTDGGYCMESDGTGRDVHGQEDDGHALSGLSVACVELLKGPDLDSRAVLHVSI